MCEISSSNVCVSECACVCTLLLVYVCLCSPGFTRTGTQPVQTSNKNIFSNTFPQRKKRGIFLLLHEWKTRARSPRGRGCSVMSCCCHGYCVIIVLSQGETVIWSSCSALLAARQIDTLQSHTHTLILHTSKADLKHAPRNSSSFGLVFRLISRCRCVCLC